VCFEQLGEAECRTAVMALRAALTASAAASAHDVPKMMCQILQQLVQDHNTVRLISAGMERRQSTAQHQGTTKNMTPQDTIKTITELVEGSAGDSATKSSHNMHPPHE